MKDMTFKERLKQMRKELGYNSQKDFALFIGESREKIAQWEAGNNFPQFDSLTNLLTKTGYSADWLLCLNPTKQDARLDDALERLSNENDRLDRHIQRLEREIADLRLMFPHSTSQLEKTATKHKVSAKTSGA